MSNAFSIALSALAGNSVAVDAIGNNLANMNTTGFKASGVSFHDLVTQSLGASFAQVGAGISPPSIVSRFTQGAIQATGGGLDAAIQGQGFFIVRNSSGQTLYTRAGNFRMDANGNLLTSTGERVQGWTGTRGVVNTSSAIGNMTIPVGAILPPSATTQMTMDLNLDAGAATNATFSAPIEVVDSLGTRHVLTVTFTNNGGGSWKYEVSIPGGDLKNGTPGTPSLISGASGTLTFDSSGKLKSPASTGAPISIKVSGLADGAADMSVDWSLYDTDANPTLTQFGQPSAVSGTTQDGATSGQITGVSISDGGSVLAHYSNGQQQIIGQLALASFRNPESLVSVGNNNLQVSADTSAAVIGEPETGARGTIVGGALESSTVDMAREFTNLIVMERSYQANAKVITTADELSQETVNLKR